MPAMRSYSLRVEASAFNTMNVMKQFEEASGSEMNFDKCHLLCDLVTMIIRTPFVARDHLKMLKSSESYLPHLLTRHLLGYFATRDLLGGGGVKRPHL